MTTTIDLSDDLAVKAERLCQEMGISYEEVLRWAFREGLGTLDASRRPAALGGSLIDGPPKGGSKALVIAEVSAVL